MKISIIIPVYNAEKFIEETLESALNQQTENFEVLVVNDGSTDKTLDILSKYQSNKKVKIISIKNSGVSNARNIGFSQSKGAYIAFLDADDVWLKNNLSEKVELLERNENLGLVHSDCEIIDSSGKSTGEIKSGISGNILDDLLLWEETCIPAPSSILVKREVIDHVGGFNTNLSTAADQEFFFRVAAKYTIGHISKVTWHYRIHGQNMHQNIKHMEKDHIRAYQIAEQLNLFKSNSFRNKCYANLYFILAGSWWVNKNKHPRAILFLLKSVLKHPGFFFTRLFMKL